MMFRRLLETLSVFQWVLTFLLMGVFCSLLTGYLLLTRFWPLAALYLAWLTIDRHTPERGGRRSQWVRNWTVWRYMRDYFPISMVKMADLDPKRNYVFGSHPHGIMCFGTFCNFCTEANGFSGMFPGITPHLATLSGLFRLPIFRDYLLSGGGCSVSRSSLGHILSERGAGNAVIIVVGGAAESMAGTPGDHSVLLKDRMGFIRLALSHGADLVPVYSFGENDVFEQLVFRSGSWMKSLQVTFQKWMGFAPCLFRGRGLLSARSWGLLPYAKPVMTVVGEPITVRQSTNPSEEEVSHYHAQYMEALVRLFNKYKGQYGLSETTQLTIY
ncbi:diacylglycerol O-acyltransferase 2-like [Hemiscyllium ocellatum]|uniref:diacylglycerol O-acyltransferase 2-like n=1 Tax=Hemiscyllium ocellatum TaxID=170820 RepID=UPI002966AD8D|nr:diacylglycerol O-acyltransferase 2-like [Hemiscyllium ocellatum]